MRTTLALVAAATASTGTALAKTHLLEKFEGDSFAKNWVKSSWKDADQIGAWDVSSGEWFGNEAAARGMRTTQDARFYSVSRRLEAPFSNEGKDLVVQFAVKNEKKESSFCGGGYIKLMPSTVNQDKFGGDSPYNIMFGPDLCGYDVSRVHLIFSKDGENMLKKDDIKLEWADKNEFTHLYTLVVRPDNTYEVFVDGKSRDSGNLGNGQWAKFPLKEIDDPTDKKPADWEDNAKMVDPAAKKPEDWDENEPQMIKDPAAAKPADWDDAEDGEWEAPTINNPKYKGKWNAPMIDNPKYKGVWAPKKIPNPDYVPTSYIYKDIGVVGFELWVVNSGSIFSNIIITDSLEEAEKLAKETFHPFVEAEKDAKKAYDDKNKPKEDPAAAAAAGGEDGEDAGAAGGDDDDKEEL